MRVFIEGEDGSVIEVVPLATASKKLGYSPTHLRLLCDTGQLAGMKVLGRWCVPLETIRQRLDKGVWLKQNRVKPDFEERT